MNTTRFDSISRRFAQRRLSRRQALQQGGAGIAAAGLAAAGLHTATAQDATPPALPTDPLPSADSAGAHPEYLFVQPFDSGTWAPKDGAAGTYTLTLTGAAAQTTYFSDRPERIVGLAPTPAFLDGLGFTPENPPNAALVAQTDTGEQDILVIELLAPVYDADSGTLTYDATVLADYGERGLAHLAQQQADYELPETLGEGRLFIDDCEDSTDYCWLPSSANDGTYNEVGYINSGNCWNWGAFLCQPCESYSWLCNQAFPDDCQGNCLDDIALCLNPGCHEG